MKMVSVIMPAYNAEKYIAEAVDSILEQTYGDFEFIILNDCSRDRTEEIVLSYNDPRIVYLKNEENLGVAATLNKGLAVAKGDYIVRMDADDISLPERFEKQAAYLDAHKDVAVLGTNVESFGEAGTICTGWSATDPEQMKVDLLFACGLAHPSVMMRADMIRELGGYDESFNGLEDYELWCRVLENHKITTLPDILLRYRIHGSQVTQNPSARYLELLRTLKTRQLRQLGLEPNEEFFSYCQGGKLDRAEKVKALDAFFVLLEEANAEKKIYDGEKLWASFRSVIGTSAVKLPKREQKKLAGSCHYINKRELFLLQLRQFIKKILGRN
jgi:glycosyltransferase involved in cell wall biosynthesis